jgi:hypothetical protein
MFKTEFIKFNDRLYILKKTIDEKYNPNVDAWKEYLGADTVLKKENILYFAELVPDLEIIEDEPKLQKQ